MRNVSGGARPLASIVGGFRWDGVRRCNSTGGEDTPHLRSLKHRLETLSRDLPDTFDLVLLDGAKALYADVLHRVEACLRPGSLVLADDARHCPEFVTHMRSDANRYVSVPLAGDLELAMRLL